MRRLRRATPRFALFWIKHFSPEWSPTICTRLGNRYLLSPVVRHISAVEINAMVNLFTRSASLTFAAHLGALCREKGNMFIMFPRRRFQRARLGDNREVFLSQNVSLAKREGKRRSQG